MRKLLCLLALAPLFSFAQKYDLTPLNKGTNTSIRGLSIVSGQVAWVSGSNGTIGKTLNGGKTWEWIKPEGFEKLDFRDVEAFDQNKAIVVNAGSPAYVLLTEDGGKTWKTNYKNLDSAIFLDGMGFWDKNTGIIFGDPIGNKLQLLKTRDGGLNWQNVSDHLKLEMKNGEAGFAASGTSIRTLSDGNVWIATGGTVSNIYHSNNFGYTWKKYPCPIWQGENSTGAFSIDFYNSKKGVVVGGDYRKDKENTNNVLYTSDGGKTWLKPVKPVAGYRSGVTFVNAQTVVAVGTSGVDVSSDGGQKWTHISDLSFNSVGRSKTGNLILMAGNDGQIYRLKITAH